MTSSAEQDADERRRESAASAESTPYNPIDAWAAKEATHLAGLQAKLQRDQLTRAELVYEQRRFDNVNLVYDNADEARRLQREEQDRKTGQLAEQNEKTLIEQARTIGDLKDRLEANGRDPLDTINQRVNEREEGKQSHDDYYGHALRQQNDPNDPYGTMMRTASAELAEFRRDQETLQRQIENTPNADTQRSIEQAKDLRAAVYMAATNHRIADQAELITGNRHDDTADTYREKAGRHEQEAQNLRDDYRARTGQELDEHPSLLERASDDNRSKRQEAEQEALHSPRESDKYGWTDYGQELTERQRQRLDALAAQNEGCENEKANDRERPSRPVGRGVGM